MKTTIIILISALFSFGSLAQTIEIPKDYKLKEAADYEKYESEVLQCITWLKGNSLDKNKSKQKRAMKFVMDWVDGSPDVMVMIDGNLLNFLDSSPHLLFYFIAGWTENSVMTENHKDVSANALAGMEMVLQVYKNNKGLTGKDKAVEKWLKLQAKGKLKEQVDKKMAAYL